MFRSFSGTGITTGTANPTPEPPSSPSPLNSNHNHNMCSPFQALVFIHADNVILVRTAANGGWNVTVNKGVKDGSGGGSGGVR